MTISRLTREEREAALTALPHWRWDADGDALIRSFAFRDFRTAFAFMTRVADLAEMQDHHPDWSNVYNRVTIRLTTHDAGGVTGRDIKMAHSIDEICGE